MGPEPGALVPSGGAGPAFGLFSDWSLFLGVSVLPSSGQTTRVATSSGSMVCPQGDIEAQLRNGAHGSVDSFCPLQAQHVMAP